MVSLKSAGTEAVRSQAEEEHLSRVDGRSMLQSSPARAVKAMPGRRGVQRQAARVIP